MAECPARRHGTRKQRAGTRCTWDPLILVESHMVLRMLKNTIDRTWQKRSRLCYYRTSSYSELNQSIRIGEMERLRNFERCDELRKYQVIESPVNKWAVSEASENTGAIA